MKNECENLRKDLLFSYIDIQTEKARNIKVRAYAELILKAFFLKKEKRWCEISDIKKIVEDFSNIKRVPVKSIQQSLEFLTHEIVYFDFDGAKNRWRMKESKFNDISVGLEKNQEELNLIIDNFLSTGMDQDVVKKWFLFLCEIIFSKEEEKILRMIAKKKIENIGELDIKKELEESIIKFNLTNYKDELMVSFNEFIFNLNSKDAKFLFLLSQSILTSKIIAIDLDIDSLFVNLLKNSYIFVDTNIFVEQILGEGELTDLFESLSGLGVSFYYIKETKDEFENLVESRNASVRVVIDKDDKIQINDDFYSLAKKYKCTNSDEVDTFFKENFLPFPPKANDVVFNEFLDGESGKIREKISQETKLMNSERCSHLAAYKSREKIIHDITLNDFVVECKKKKQNAMILTKDGRMYNYSLDNMKKQDKLPAWVHVRNLLAIVSAAVPYREGFLKIFRILLRDSCCLQDKEGFAVKDVEYLINNLDMVEIEECSKISECVEITRKHRLAFNKPNSEELKKNLEDIINQKKEIGADIIKATHKKEIDEKNKELEKYNNFLVNTEKTRIKRKILIGYVIFIIGSLFLGAIISYFLCLIIKKCFPNHVTDWISNYFALFTIVEAVIIAVCTIVIPAKWKKEQNGIQKKAEQKVSEILGK